MLTVVVQWVWLWMWSMSWSTTTPFINLPANARFDTGLYVLSTRSRFTFLRRGFTRASLMSWGNTPLLMDSLTTAVMRGSIVSRQSFRSIVHVGSLSQLLLGYSLMHLVTCSTVKGLKELWTGEAEHWATGGARDTFGLPGWGSPGEMQWVPVWS